MPRPPRLHVEGLPYHITCRGDNREPIFLDDIDYQHYLLLLSHYKRECEFLLLVYCLMPNHLHLLMQPSQVTVSRIMHGMLTRYTQHFNKRYGRVGHLFQGRYHSRLIRDDAYLIAASRYIHCNPVKAGLCASPQSYPWSSYRVYESIEQDRLQLVDSARVLGLLGCGRAQQVRAYQELIMPSSGAAVRVCDTLEEVFHR